MPREVIHDFLKQFVPGARFQPATTTSTICLRCFMAFPRVALRDAARATGFTVPATLTRSDLRGFSRGTVSGASNRHAAPGSVKRWRSCPQTTLPASVTAKCMAEVRVSNSSACHAKSGDACAGGLHTVSPSSWVSWLEKTEAIVS